MENLVINNKFWKDKTVFLTGHTGFKGSWLSLWLQKLEVNLIGFSKSIPTQPSLFELAHIEEGMTSIIGDIRDYEGIKKTIQKYKPDIVIHMAAQSILRESYLDPIETFSTNVMGTINLFESIRKIGNVRVILNVTSDKCYEMQEFHKSYKEDDPMGGYDPYSSSKGCAELVTSSFRTSFFNPTEHHKHGIALASVRAGNVIGGGDWGKDRLVPDIVKGILNNTIIKIRYPDATRPWQYVLDPLNGYLSLIEKLWMNGPEFSEGWNFGPLEENTRSVQWIVEKLNENWDGKINWEKINSDNLHEANYLKLDCSKAKEKLGWRSKLNLESTLIWTVEWYKQYQQNKDIRKFSEQQIDDFISIL